MKASVFLSYCKSRWKVAGAFILFMLIFWMVLSLYRSEVEAVLYASILICACGFVFSVADYLVFSKKHRMLKGQLAILSVGLEEIPRAGNILEEDYQKIIGALFAETRELTSRMDLSLSEMTDYYTLWAHQIKTPIAAMRLLLQGEEESERNKELCQQLFQVEQYVEMVLHYLRLESMSSDLELGRYDLLKLVNRSVKKYSVVFIHKKIAVEIGDIDCKVITDEKWLSFVIEQLLSNALKYTRKGKIIVQMDDYARDTLVIRDTGIGIRPEDLPRIFERGFTGFNGRMYQKSTGIGLYLCKRIIDKLSHGIEIISAPGEGTTVRLFLGRNELEID